MGDSHLDRRRHLYGEKCGYKHTVVYHVSSKRIGQTLSLVASAFTFLACVQTHIHMKARAQPQESGVIPHVLSTLSETGVLPGTH